MELNCRLYTAFGADLKVMRLREKLKKLSRRPELYNRNLVDETCFDAIDHLMALRFSKVPIEIVLPHFKS